MDRGKFGYSSRAEETLCNKIDNVHLIYLEAEESPAKIDEKKNLEVLIKEYLSIVPHNKKFVFAETAHVLHNSVVGIEDFSAYRTTAAWTALAAYAHNLIKQPWRKEFREIKTYSGFYQHHIETSLIGGEQILHLMGYENKRYGIMALEGDVNQKRVINVSRDAFFALVECQIMRTIIEEMVKYGGYYTWLDVLHYRETYTCSPQEAINNIISLIQQQYYYKDFPMCSNIDPMACQRTYHRNNPGIPPQAIYTPANQQAFGNYIQQPCYPLCSSNGYFASPHSNFATAPMKPHIRSVPTGQLIELEPTPCSNTAYHKRRQFVPYEEISSKSRDDKSNVYWPHDCNRSGNSISQSKEDIRVITDSFHSLKLSGTSNPGPPMDSSLYPKQETCSMSRRKTKDYSTVDSSSTLPNREKSKKSKEVSVSSEDQKNYWPCFTCTYHNPLQAKVCEICFKSKVHGNEIQPLTSGGSECPSCTLINAKGVKNCRACSKGLKNSPTYI